MVVGRDRAGMRHTAVCEHCSLQVSAGSERRLAEVMDLLAGADTCPRREGHALTQLLPPVDPT